MMKLPPTELSQADVAAAMQDAANLFAAAIALIDGTWQHSEDRDASEQAKHCVVDLADAADAFADDLAILYPLTQVPRANLHLEA
jgi:hypothetical protein